MIKKFAALFALLAVVSLGAQERVTLSTPVFQQDGATEFRPESIYLKRSTAVDSPAEIRVLFREASGSSFIPNGRTLTCRYDGTAAETLLIALNKMNLSTISLEKRVMAQCQADGKLGAGTISGTPQ